MPMEAPIDNFNADGFESAAPGDCHAVLSAVDEDGGDRGEMICDFEILASTTPDQEGKSHREYFQKTIKAFQRIHTLAVALGLITVEKLKEHKAAGTNPTYDFSAAVGRQLCIGLSDEEYNGKHRTKANFNLYHVTDARVASWPKDASMLAKAGIVLPTKSAGAGADVGSALKGL